MYIKQIPKQFNLADDNEQYKLVAKLQHRYHGPHLVVATINPVIFEVNINGKVKRVHANKMKRAIPRTRTRDPTVQQPLNDHELNDNMIPIDVYDNEMQLLPPAEQPPQVVPPQAAVNPALADSTTVPRMNNLYRPNTLTIRPFPNTTSSSYHILGRNYISPAQHPVAQDTGS